MEIKYLVLQFYNEETAAVGILAGSGSICLAILTAWSKYLPVPNSPGLLPLAFFVSPQLSEEMSLAQHLFLSRTPSFSLSQFGAEIGTGKGLALGRIREQLPSYAFILGSPPGLGSGETIWPETVAVGVASC